MAVEQAVENVQAGFSCLTLVLLTCVRSLKLFES